MDFNKFDNSVYIASLSGTRLNGNAFDYTTLLNAGYGNNGLATQFFLRRKGRYLVRVHATLTNASTVNNRDTGFSIAGSITVNRYVSRPGTDAAVSVALSGEAYVDCSNDINYTESGGTLLQINAYSAGSDNITIVTGHVIVTRINSITDGYVQ